MSKDEEFNFTVIDDNGNEVICDVISLLKDTTSKDIYVVYTDYSLNKNNQINTYLSLLKEDKDGYSLKSVDNKDKYEYLMKNAKSIYGKELEELMAK